MPDQSLLTTPLPNSSKIRKIGILAFPGAEILDIAGPFEVFSFASIGLQRQGKLNEFAYPIEIIAEQPGPITTLSGLQIVATHSYHEIPTDIDTLLIPGANDMLPVVEDKPLVQWITQMAPQVRRLASVCSGAFLLAECGLLDHRRATTHWAYSDQLQQRYPAVDLQPDQIYIRDEHIYSSGGITSGIDLALALVAEDWGQELALFVARYLVVFLQRPGGQAQFSAFLLSRSSERLDFRELQAFIIEHPEQDLSVEALADRMAMSPRNFARQFVVETGMTPAKFVELARLDAARQYLTGSDLPIESVADKAGFNDPERMRRTFIRQLGVNPQSYRSRFSART